MVRPSDQRFEIGRRSSPPGFSSSCNRLRPLDGAAAPVHQIDAALPRYLRPITIVWCEDNPAVAEVLSSALRVAGFGSEEHGSPADRIFFTSCGEAALALVDDHDADIFATDECHPTGPGGLALLRALCPHSDLVLGYVTGAAIDAEAKEMADFCASKPFDVHRFIQASNEILKRVRARTYRPRRGVNVF